jgi:hypothetical protein
MDGEILELLPSEGTRYLLGVTAISNQIVSQRHALENIEFDGIVRYRYQPFLIQNCNSTPQSVRADVQLLCKFRECHPFPISGEIEKSDLEIESQGGS